MALFRRTSKGRHALGAAVTSIQSGPLQVHVPPPLAAPRPPVAAPPPETSWAAAVPEPDVMTSIADLIASGQAWNTEPAPPPAWREPVEVPAAVPPPPAPAPAVPARPALEAALADLLPVQPDGAAPTGPPREAAFVPTPTEPCVQLGFRDGTSTSLDPSSSQSRALQELAQTLTRRD